MFRIGSPGDWLQAARPTRDGPVSAPSLLEPARIDRFERGLPKTESPSGAPPEPDAPATNAAKARAIEESKARFALKRRQAEARIGVDFEAAIAEEPAKLLGEAETLLRARGIAFRSKLSSEGYEALEILPSAQASLLGESARDLRDNLDGFSFLYCPKKLLKEGTRGVNDRYRRELFMSHEALERGALDPITVHEIEHVVLSRCEEKGIPQLFTGNVNSFNGKPVSSFASEVGGYFWSLSFQEISAYSIQCELLSLELSDALVAGASEPKLQGLLDEIEAIAAWGWALSGRIEDVASRALEHLEADPWQANFERFSLVVRPSGQQERSAGLPCVWFKTVNLPDLSVQTPLAGPRAKQAFDAMQAAATGTEQEFKAKHAVLSGLAIEHLQALKSAASALRPRFQLVRDAAEEGASAKVLQATKAMRQESLRLSGEYRTAWEKDPSPS